MKYRAMFWVCLICSFPGVSAAAGLRAQGDDAARILGQAQAGVLSVIYYGPDKVELIAGKSSAIVVAPDLVATAYHMVLQAADAEVMNNKGKKFKVEGVAGFDKALDIALLRVKGKFQPLPQGNGDILKEGERVFAVGSNESGDIKISEGAFRRYLDLGDGLKVMEISVGASDQFRGGPVVNAAGEVVAMFLAFDKNVTVGLPVGRVAGVTGRAKAAAIKDMPKEYYFNTREGGSLAGLTAYAEDNMGAAAFFLQKAVAGDPEYLDGYMLLGSIYGRQRDFQAAEGAYVKAVALKPDKAEAYYGLGKVRASMTRYAEAAEAFEKAVSLGIPVKEIYLDLGGVLENIPDWARAAAAYEKFLAARPESAWSAELRLGICRMNLKDYPGALAALGEAEKARPDDLKIKNTLAEAYDKDGRQEQAEEVYYAMAALEPKYARTYYNQAVTMYEAAGKPDKALAPCKRILDLEPTNADYRFQFGLKLFNLKRYDEAIESFKKALELKPDYPAAWFQIGSAEFNLQKFKEAIAAYKNYAGARADDPAGWLSIGVSYMYLKDYESALEPIKKCVDLAPDNAVYLYNLAVCYINLHDNYSAREIRDKLVKIDPALAEKLKKALKQGNAA